MKANTHSFNSYPRLLVLLLISIVTGLTAINAQCPTVTNSMQSLCDVESVLVGDLVATDNGGGIVWYETATSTVPLLNSQSLIDGEDYYADDNTGTCGARSRVDITIYSAPTGQNFQGICLDDPTLATVANLIAIGNDVQWYLTPTGGSPLLDSTILIDNAIYYADQANPDTGCRTSRLSVLVNVGFTPIPTGEAIQEFCVTPSFTPTVGDLVASGLNNWYISLFSALPLSSSAPLINGQVYYGTSLDPPCESSGRFATLVILNNGPDPGISAELDLCVGNTNTAIDLFTILGGSPEPGGTWSPLLNSGTNIFNGNIDPDGVYTYTVTSTNICPDATSTVTVTTSPLPNSGTNGTIDICDNGGTVDLFNSLGGTPEPVGTWSPTLTSGTGVFNPLADTAGIYTYTVSGVPPCNDSSTTVTVSVTPFRDAGTDGILEICNSNGTVDLFDSLGGTPDIGGVWSPLLNSGTGVFDPLLDSQGTYTYTFSGNSPCPDTSALVNVIVNDLPNAGTDTIIEICSNEVGVINLFDNLGGTPEAGGTWSPVLTSGTNIFDPTNDSVGVYTYTLQGTSPCPNISASITIIEVVEPNAGMDVAIDICDNNGTIDLFNTLGGTPDIGGTWSPLLNSGSNIFDPLIDSEGTYTYTVIGTSPCADASAEVTISVAPFLEAGEDGSLIICSNDTSIDLFDSLGGTPNLGGTWSPVLNSGTGVFDPNIDSGGVYTYTISNSTTLCSSSSANVIVTLLQEPNAGIDGTLNLCNSTNSVDLFDSLGGTPDTGGTWTPILTSATGLFDPNTDLEGTYTYTVNSTCGTNQATVTISFTNLNDAGTNSAIELCSNDASQDLFNSLGGTPQPGGIWLPTLNSGTGVFDPSIDTSGTYIYTVANSSSLCAPASAAVIVTLLQEPNAGTDGTLNLCEATNAVDLFSSLGGTPDVGGTWSPLLSSGTGLLDPSLDPEGIYIYTVSSTCGTSTAEVNVSFTNENNAGTNGAIELCNTDAPIDLFNSLGGTPELGGIWSPALISGTGIFDPNSDTGGSYTYSISNVASLCEPSSALINVTLLQEPNAGTDGTLNLCASTNTVDLFDSLGGTPDIGGTWSPTLNSGTGLFDSNIDSEGTYTYTVNSTCGTSFATVNVSFTDLNDAGTNGTIDLCSNDTAVDLFNSLGGTPQIGGIWSPALNSGTGIFDPNSDTAGTYTYTISSIGSLCPDASATIEVTLIQAPNSGFDGSVNICLNNLDPIDLFDLLEGTPDTGGVWAPLLTSGTGVFDPAIDNAGSYTYTLNSICGSTFSTVFVNLSEPNDAGINGTLEICENDTATDLFDSLGGTPDIGGFWSPSLTSGSGIFDPSFDPGGVYTYFIGNEASSCPQASSTVLVTLNILPNSGTDSTLNICIDDINLVDLFDNLGGTPSTSGTWSPALTSGTGVFDPTTDTAGIYTYTVNSTECNFTESTDVTVVINDIPDATGLTMSVDDFVCLSNDVTVSITGASQLIDGNYTIVYQLSDANTSLNTIGIVISNGNASFIIPENLLQNTGSTLITISQLFFLGQTCSADTQFIPSTKVEVEDAPTPQLIANGGEFCEIDNPTIADLTNNIIESDIIIWYNSPTDGDTYSSADLLVDGQTYYAGIQTENGCESLIRLEVTVTLISCIGELLIPDGFSPNGDNINDVFDILFLDDLYPNFKLSIYNRYGNILYEGDINSPKWDGTSKSKDIPLPVGVYFYILDFNDGERKSIQGRLYLSR